MDQTVTAGAPAGCVAYYYCYPLEIAFLLRHASQMSRSAEILTATDMVVLEALPHYSAMPPP